MSTNHQSSNGPARRQLPPAMKAFVWQPGKSGNPAGIQGPAYREVQRLAREAAPQAIRRLVELVDSLDPRVSLLAAQAVLERAYGKPRDAELTEAVPARPDLSALSQQDRTELGRIVAKLVDRI